MLPRVAAPLGALAALLIFRGTLESPKAASRLATMPVVVATRDMPEGAIIDRTAVAVAQWPAGTQPWGAYTTIDSVANRVTRVAVYKGEAMVPGRLAPNTADANRKVKITPGKRAYGIRISDAASLSGMVQPDSRVDIMVVIQSPRRSGPRTAKLFMSNMRVLAIGEAPGRAGSGSPGGVAVLSIEVTPDEAGRLAVAAARGQLQLALRGDDDADSVATAPVVRPPARR